MLISHFSIFYYDSLPLNYLIEKILPTAPNNGDFYT